MRENRWWADLARVMHRISPPLARKWKRYHLRNDSRNPLSSTLKADVVCPEERGAKRIRNQLSRWLTLPPEAFFFKQGLLFHDLPVFDKGGGVFYCFFGESDAEVLGDIKVQEEVDV